MTRQRDLDWGTEPRARTSDPGTSKVAAESMKPTASDHHQLILDIIHQLHEATPEEIADYSRGRLDKVQVCKRVREMKRLKLIAVAIDQGQDKTRKNSSGRRARVWRVA